MFCFWKRAKKYFPQTFLVLLAVKFESALSGESMNYFAKVYIDSALVGLVGTASLSNFSVVYEFPYTFYPPSNVTYTYG